MRTKHVFGFAIATTSLIAGAGVAAAQEADEEERSGFAIIASGGVEDFSGETMRDTSDVSGIWGIRADYTYESLVGIEAGYLGTAANVNAPIGGTSATLVGSTVEALAKVMVPDLPVQPYAFVGAAWRRYDVVGEEFTTSDAGMDDSDDVFQIPLGAGVGYRYRGLVADARFTFRPTTGEDLVITDTRNEEFAPMHTWGVSAGLGYEF
jgi:hypothetical protein